MEESAEISIKKTYGVWPWIRQNVLIIFAIVSAIGSWTYFSIRFYIRSSDSWTEIENIKKDVMEIKKTKADQATVDANQKSIQDRLQRQYEGNNTRDARMTEIEKEAAYERGRHDAEEKSKK